MSLRLHWLFFFTVCAKREGDSQWLKKKCLSSTFLSKYGPTCQDLCSSDDEFLNEHPEICSTFEEPESLEEIVKKCANLEYYKDNEEKCEVVEKIDLVLLLTLWSQGVYFLIKPMTTIIQYLFLNTRGRCLDKAYYLNILHWVQRGNIPVSGS